MILLFQLRLTIAPAKETPRQFVTKLTKKNEYPPKTPEKHIHPQSFEMFLNYFRNFKSLGPHYAFRGKKEYKIKILKFRKSHHNGHQSFRIEDAITSKM